MIDLQLYFKGQVYRCTGYRMPEPGEQYVSKDAKIKRAPPNTAYDGVRLIVRQLDRPKENQLGDIK